MAIFFWSHWRPVIFKITRKQKITLFHLIKQRLPLFLEGQVKLGHCQFIIVLGWVISVIALSEIWLIIM